MNGNLGILISCVSLLCVVIVESEVVKLIKTEIERNDDIGGNQAMFFGNKPSNNNNEARQVVSTVYQTVNKYCCALDPIVNGSHLMVYGTNGWTFPVQDVNLTLRYPPENTATQHFQFIFNGENTTPGEEDYIITGFKVILYIDGPDSEGFINEGGVLQDTITLSFVSSQLTSLSYEFWLFGVRKDYPGVIELNSHNRLC